MRGLAAALVLALSGCGEDGFGVHLTVEVEGCAGLGAELAKVVELRFVASGDESWDQVAKLKQQPLGCTERARYLPKPSTRRLSIAVTARDTDAQPILQGTSGTFTIEPDRFTEVPVRLRAGGVNDDLSLLDDGGINGDGSVGDSGSDDAAVPDLSELPLCPNVLILIDATGSMGTMVSSGIPDGGTRAKLDLELKSVIALARRHDGRVPLGLGRFAAPSTAACDQGNVLMVPVARNTADTIETQLTSPAFTANGQSNAGQAVGYFSLDTSLLAAGTPAYILLVTDGTGCPNASSGPSLAVTTLQAAAGRGVRTVVVGFAPTVTDEPGVQAMGSSGGVACTDCGGPSYYPASKGTELDAALEKAMQRIAGNCR